MFIIDSVKHITELQPYENILNTSYEVIYVKEGTAEFTINSYEYIVEANSLVFINCFEPYSVNVISEKYDCKMVAFNRIRLDKLLNEPSLVSIMKIRPKDFVHCIKAVDDTEKFFKVFFDEYKNHFRYFDEEMVICKLKELLILIHRQDSVKFPNAYMKVSSSIFEIKDYIDNHFQEKINITKLAEDFFINKFYLSHSFKTVFGYSPKEYLILNRVSYAKVLLRETDYNITTIAAKSGFSDSNSFIHYFKSYYKFTPTGYRKFHANMDSLSDTDIISAEEEFRETYI